MSEDAASNEIPPEVRALLAQAEALTQPWEMLERITLLEQALSLVSRPPASGLWAAIQVELGTALAQASTGEHALNLTRAIAAFRAALTVFTPENAPNAWATTQANLGSAWRARAASEAWPERRAILNEAIAAFHAALSVHTHDADPNAWATIQNNLGNALSNLAELKFGQERRALLEQAITAFHAALSVHAREDAPTDWAMTQNNLGVSLRDRAGPDQGEAAHRATLNEAITAFHAALSVRTRENAPAAWAMTQNNLAIALSDRAGLEKGDERRATWDEVIAVFRDVLEVYTRERAPIAWATIQNNLGNALSARAGMEQAAAVRRALLEQATTALHAAVNVHTSENSSTDWATTQANLGRTYGAWMRLETGHARGALLAQAIAAYRAALTVYTPRLAPVRYRNVARDAGKLLFDEGDWEEAAELYAMAVDVQDDLFALSLTTQDRSEHLQAGSDMAEALAYALVHLRPHGTTNMGTSPAALQAATALERSRTRASGEALAREQAQLEAAERVAPELLGRFIAASDHLANFTIHTPGTMLERNISGDAHAIFAEASAARQEYDAALAAIRVLHPDFLHPGNLVTDAVTLLREGERLVYVACTLQGATAIMIAPGAGASSQPYAEAWWDERLTANVVADLLARGNDDGRLTGGLLPAQYGVGQLNAEVHRAMMALGASDGVLTRLAQQAHAQGVRRLIIIPCGLLGLLPLHAALVSERAQLSGGPDDGDDKRTVHPPVLAPLQDIARVSYAASARTWAASRRRVAPSGRLGNQENHANGPLEALVVGNPLPQPAAHVLTWAETEAAAVRQLVAALPGAHVVPPERMLDGEQATRRSVLEALQHYRRSLTHAHFACHGLVELDDAERSGLLLANGARLMVRDLRDDRQLRFERLRLATLSACQTGLPGARLPDEAVGLPTAWLLAGAVGVVASLWTVSDSATVALMTKVYELHLLDDLEPGDALWLAQCWFRGVPEWREIFHKEGASVAAKGPEAREVVRAIADIRSEANPLNEDDIKLESTDDPDTNLWADKNTEAHPASGCGTDEDQVKGSQWEMARHWAAFAHYGA